MWSPRGLTMARAVGTVGLLEFPELLPSPKSPTCFFLFSPSGVYKIWEVLHV